MESTVTHPGTETLEKRDSVYGDSIGKVFASISDSPAPPPPWPLHILSTSEKSLKQARTLLTAVGLCLWVSGFNISRFITFVCQSTETDSKVTQLTQESVCVCV